MSRTKRADGERMEALRKAPHRSLGRGLKQDLHRHLQSLRNRGHFIVQQRSLAALNFSDLRLVYLDALPGQASRHVLLRNPRGGRQADSLDGCARQIAGGFSAFRGSLQGELTVYLFRGRLILPANNRNPPQTRGQTADQSHGGQAHP